MCSNSVTMLENDDSIYTFKLISNMTTGIVSCALGARKGPVMKIVIIIAGSFLLLLTIVYTTVYALHSGETTPKNRTLAEKLVSIEKQVIEALPARPFINDLRGDSPSSFSQTTPIYPENHRYPGRPNNILDIINYITNTAHRQKQRIKEQFPQDPFFAFKPQDPSDINLLAPNSFRFGPAIVPKPAKKGVKAEESEMRNFSLTYMKPLKVTLNIYPSGDKNLGFQGPGVTPRYRYQHDKPGKMVVHMNLYPKLTDRNRHIFPHDDYQHPANGFANIF
ncbi:uncharacterized protein LOC116164912 [Photinus pyralis]|nr:uncharacterized protein LOC116164912 [Photinus pyralis]